MRRRFVRRAFPRGNGAKKQNLSWSSISGAWTFASITVTTATPLIQLESPVNLTSLTSDPPEDLTLLRIVGSFLVSLSALSEWTLGLLVQDATWTPGATFPVDADKRILWHKTFQAITSTGATWTESETYFEQGMAGQVARQTLTTVDIQPRVRIEPGKALYLCAWENAGAGTFLTSTTDMRVLYKRSGRR